MAVEVEIGDFVEPRIGPPEDITGESSAQIRRRLPCHQRKLRAWTVRRPMQRRLQPPLPRVWPLAHRRACESPHVHDAD